MQEKGSIPFEMRRVLVPGRRFKGVKNNWMKIYTPIVAQCKLEIRMNLQARAIEVRTCKDTVTPVAIQRAEEFIRAVVLGFSVEDALAILRMDTIYVNCFDIGEVRMLRNAHIGRAIGRITGTNGRIKMNIENITQTRIVVEDKHIRVMGTAENISLARTAISRLIMGSQPAKVCTDLRTVSKKVHERL